MKALLILFIVVILGACGTSRGYMITVSKPEGFVSDVRGHAVDVCFPLVSEKQQTSFACHTFYLEGGHEYQIGDRYPDYTKYNHR